MHPPGGAGAPPLADGDLGGRQHCVAKSSRFLSSIVFSKCETVRVFIPLQLHWLAGFGSEPWASALGFSFLIFVMVSPSIGLLGDQMRK